MDPSQFATAYALSTSVGLRAFMTLAIAALAVHFGLLHPSTQFAWLGSDGMTLAFIGLAVVEFFGDKIPMVDHFLHAVNFATKPIAAAILTGSAIPDAANGGNDAALYTAMAAGAANAFGIHTVSATARGASTAMTMGLANPLVSVLEDAIAVIGIVIAFFLPWVGAVIAVALTLLLIILARRVWNAVGRRRSAA